MGRSSHIRRIIWKSVLAIHSAHCPRRLGNLVVRGQQCRVIITRGSPKRRQLHRIHLLSDIYPSSVTSIAWDLVIHVVCRRGIRRQHRHNLQWKHYSAANKWLWLCKVKDRRTTNQQLIDYAKNTKIKVSIFRLANVYGPNQDTGKDQGLISTITHSLLHHKPVNIFVPLQTVRNYIYADDAGEVIARNITQLTNEKKSKIYLKLVASDRNISLSSLINEFRLVYGHRPTVFNSVSGATSKHPINLRLQSIISDPCKELSFTPLAVGIDRVRKSALVTK